VSTVLIVGAGLTGLSAARHALERGWAPLLVDKGTGPGGRLATRWIGEREARFDTGAQFF
jgi:renalase